MDRKVVLTITTDGRQELFDIALASLMEHVVCPATIDGIDLTHGVVVDDSGVADDPLWPAVASLTSVEYVRHQHRLGFAQTVRDVWQLAVDTVPDLDYVFHAEDDFTYNVPVDLLTMAHLLERYPQLAQLALKRDPVNLVEYEAGGFMQTHPRSVWTERPGVVYHTLNFTTNPCLIPRRIVDTLLSSGAVLSEPNITECLLHCGYGFGYLGTVDDEPRVTHIGAYRSDGWAE